MLSNDREYAMFARLVAALEGIDESLRQIVQPKPEKPKEDKPVNEPAYSPEFESAWKAYPKRAGGNPKKDAYKAWGARVKQFGKEEMYSMTQGVCKYAKFCEATHKVGTEFILQGATFFGPSRRYLDDFIIPQERVRIPADDHMLEPFAVKMGLHTPGQAPANLRNMQEYRQWILSKL